MMVAIIIITKINKKMEKIKEIIEQMPGYVSVIDLDLKYLAVNQKLADLMKLDSHSFIGKTAGNDCQHQRSRIENLVNSTVGTEINWEYCFKNICLAVSSKRNDTYIINQAVDITEQKQLQKRQQILLQTIPEITEKQDQDLLSKLVYTLTNKPIVSENQTESLIKLEVELRQVSTRLSNLEKLLYLDDSSFISRIKELEIHQKNDSDSWEDFKADKQLIKDFSRILCVLTNIPGGFKTWIILALILNMGLIFISDLAIKYLDFKQVIPEYIKK